MAVSASAAPAQVTAAVAAQPTPAVSAQASVAPATGASAQAAAPATPATAPSATVSAQTPAATVETYAPSAPTPAAAPAQPATRRAEPVSATSVARTKAHLRTTRPAAADAPGHTVRTNPASRRADAPPLPLEVGGLSPAAAHPQTVAGATTSPQDSSSPAWPQVPAGTFGLGGAASAGASSPLLLFALTLMFLVLALPSLGGPLPIRLHRLRSASPRFRLERPG